MFYRQKTIQITPQDLLSCLEEQIMSAPPSDRVSVLEGLYGFLGTLGEATIGKGQVDILVRSLYRNSIKSCQSVPSSPSP